jgi:hypothetical protein
MASSTIGELEAIVQFRYAQSKLEEDYLPSEDLGRSCDLRSLEGSCFTQQVQFLEDIR